VITSKSVGLIRPILRSHASRFHERCISSVTFTSAHLCGNVYVRVGVARALADPSDFGLLGEQSSPNMWDSLPWRRWTAEQNTTQLALSSMEKSILYKYTHRHTQTVTDIPIYLHHAYRHVWINSPLVNNHRCLFKSTLQFATHAI